MINTIIDTIDTEASLAKKPHGLVEMIQKGDEILPAVYSGRGNYKVVNDYDKYSSYSYWRLEDTSESEEEEPGSIEPILIREYSLKYLYIVNRTKNTSNSKDLGDKLRNTVIQGMDEVTRAVENTLKVQRVRIEFTGLETNRHEIAESELAGREFPMQFLPLLFDISITIRYTKNCLIDVC